MARHVRRRARRGGKKKAHRGKSAIPRSIATPHQGAHITESVTTLDLLPGQMYLLNFSLADFQRASLLAFNFKYYRAKKVTWILDPWYNTFQEGGGGGPGYSQPYAYVVMNRTQDAGFTYQLSDLKEMGAKPQKLGGKPLIMSWTPNWVKTGLTTFNIRPTTGDVSDIQTSGNTPSYAWLACPDASAYNSGNVMNVSSDTRNLPAVPVGTRTNTVLLGGAYLWIEQAVLGTAKVCRLTCSVEWEFKNPNALAPIPGAKYNAPIDVFAPVVTDLSGNV